MIPSEDQVAAPSPQEEGFPHDPRLSKLRNKALLTAMKKRLAQLELARMQIIAEDKRLKYLAGKFHDAHKDHEDNLLDDIMSGEPGQHSPLEDARAYHQEERGKALDVWHESDKRGRAFKRRTGEENHDDSASD